MRTFHRSSLLLLLPILWACEDEEAGGLPFTLTGEGTVELSVFRDDNGNGVRDGDDPPLGGVRVRLHHWNSVPILAQDTTSSEGVVRFTAPVGTLRLELDPAVLGDSLEIMAPVSAPFLLGADSSVIRSVGLSFPHVPFQGIRGVTSGRRVFTTAFVTTPRPSFGDGEVHFQLGTTAIRATGVERTGVTPGDSVRIVGTARIQQGQPTLDSVRVFVLTPQAVQMVPQVVPTGTAASAGGGSLDARLVEVRNGVVVSAGADPLGFRVVVDDGSGPVTLLLRSYLEVATEPLVPGSTVRAAGTLVPQGAGSPWRLLPRGAADLTVTPPPVAPTPTAP